MNPVAPVTFSLDADGVGWIVFDDPGARANVFNMATQAAFGAALSEAAASTAKALIVMSAKERIFIAGADLKLLEALPDAAAAAEFSRAGQASFQRLAALKLPVVCAIHGACAGGGFELALACHWRIATDAPVTQIGLPEVGLGTIPGWGGSVRLPRLIGAEAALGHILPAQLLPAAAAVKAGLVDEIVPVAALKNRASAVARQFAAAGRLRVRPSPPVPAASFFDDERRSTRAKTHGQQPAPLAAIDVVEQGLSLDLASALQLEALAFGQVTASAVCKNLIEVFFLREAAKKRTLAGWFPETSAQWPPIRRVGVVGAGVMGSGIAQWLAARGFEVVLRDVQPDLLVRGLGVVRGLFDEAVKRGKLSITEARAGTGRIIATTGWDGFSTCDLVIEAVVESVAAKREVFSELADIVRPGTLLASNSSALPIEETAGHVPHPERTLGLHFFNPVSRMPLVELIVGRDTSAETAGRALALVKALGKSPVICRSSPGLLVTRVLFFYLREAVRLWEEGVATEALDAALRGVGWPMGPLRLIDEIGLDVTDFIFGEMAHYFPQRFEPSRICGRLLAAELRGRKNGAGSGFYCYDQGGDIVNERAREIAGPVADHAADPQEIARQLMGVMLAEAQRCLDEGVVQSPDDIDFALLTGAGFPAIHGGLFRYARQELEPNDPESALPAGANANLSQPQ